MFNSLNTLPAHVIGFICCWQLILLGGSIWIMIVGMRERRRINPAVRNIFFVLLCVANYVLFQFTASFISKNIISEKNARIVNEFAEIPIWCLLAICFVLTVIEVWILHFINHWYNTHITSASIKEIIETLPVGICVYEESGKITLKNSTMEQICRRIAGNALLNGNEFMQILRENKSKLADFAVELGEYGIWSFTYELLEDKNNLFHMLIAYNVTEAYEKTRMLHEKQKTVQELNRKLTEYNERIKSVITAQEILNAKIRIHDEMGEGLLAIRRYLTVGGTQKERADMLERLQKNVLFLQQDSDKNAADEYTLILSTANNLGVRVVVDGILPKTEPHKHIIATAIHECFTNILRHTDGDTLFVEAARENDTLTVVFTDNNSKTAENISEKGGLGSLRVLTEKAGGQMRIITEQQYKLEITLPKEFDGYDL